MTFILKYSQFYLGCKVDFYLFIIFEKSWLKLKSELHIQLILFKFELPNISAYYLKMLRFGSLLILLSTTMGPFGYNLFLLKTENTVAK